MSDLQLNETTKDLDIIGGDLVLTKDQAAIRQHLEQRLQSFRGEWFLDLDSGVPYFQDILLKSPNPMTMDGAFKKCILETPGVLELTSFFLEFVSAQRQLKLTFSVDTINGSVDFSGFQVG